MRHIKLFFFSLLNSVYIRIIIGYLRWLYYYKILNKLKTKNSNYALKNTLAHNLTVFDKFPLDDFVMKRTSWLINSISAIEFLNNNSNFLIIGPRTESDLLKIKGSFGTTNIEAIDIISYSPWIKLQDMHSIEFSDNYFECVMNNWAIAYSENQKIVFKEMIRVLKSGGIFALGFEHHDNILIDEYKKKDQRHVNGLINSHKDINSVQDIENILLELEINFETLIKIDAPLKNIRTSEKIKLTGTEGSQIIYLAKITK